MPTVADLVSALEQLAPPHLAARWDNVGLLLGDRHSEVRRVMTCLTLTPESAAEAVDERADLVVSHHPIFFKPVQRLTAESTEGKLVWSLARSGVAVYSAHTAFDNCTGGINDLIAERLELRDRRPLRSAEAGGQVKIVVFVPNGDLAKVADAMFAAGAGNIGNYQECSFRTPGTGTFFGTEASNPSLGRKGRREEVAELRLEVVCREERLSDVIRAMRRAHSYEEPAHDIYPLHPVKVSTGEGRVGCLPRSVLLSDLAQMVKSTLGAGAIHRVGDPQRGVERVAIACGAAGEFLGDAVRAGADVFLTGEMRFHDYLSAQAQGIALLLAGHYATERPGVEHLASLLQQQLPQLHIWASRREKDPVSYHGIVGSL